MWRETENKYTVLVHRIQVLTENVGDLGFVMDISTDFLAVPPRLFSRSLKTTLSPPILKSSSDTGPLDNAKNS